MTRLCEITGKKAMSGCNVSHSNIKTKRRFLPNLHSFSLRSDILGRTIRFRLSANGIRTIEHNLGLDNYLLTTKAAKLTPKALEVKKLIQEALANKVEQ
jgi:large subunit ribosomal protein L28